MAFRFDVDGDRLTISQRRRGVRIALWILTVSLAVAVALQVFPRDRTVTVRCSRADSLCRVVRGSSETTLPIASITGVQLDDGALVLTRAGAPPYHVCRASRAELTAMADAITGFLADPQVVRVAPSCASTAGGMPLAGLLAGLAGALVILAAIGLFSVDAHTVVDRAKRTIAMRGRRWPLRRWELERPLAEVERVVVRRYYVGRGTSMHIVNVRFTDGSTARAMSPAAYLPARLAEQIATLRDFVGRPEL